jgi:plastocyanin
MDTKYIVGIVVIIILAVGGYLLLGQSGAPATPAAVDTSTQPQTTDTSAPTPTDTGSTGVSAGADVMVGSPVTVTYTDQGFSPKSVTVKAGQSVTFVDKASVPMWVASAPHPDHTGYDGTSRTTHCAAGYTGPAPFDECTTGASYTFTFNKVGTWPYHNHLSSSDFGTVVVTQ